MLSVDEEGPKQKGQFSLSEPYPFAVGVTFEPGTVSSLPPIWLLPECSICAFPLPQTALGNHYCIITLLSEWKCLDTIHSHFWSSLGHLSLFSRIILFLTSELFSLAYKQVFNVFYVWKIFYLSHIPSPNFLFKICLHIVSISCLLFTLQSLLHWLLSLSEMFILTLSLTSILPSSAITFLSSSNSLSGASK